VKALRVRTELLALAALCAITGEAAESAPPSNDPVLHPDYTAWPILEGNRPPVDLSFLNTPDAPAGRRGFLRARGEKLIFDDGTQARFWGMNLTAYALFGTPKADVKRQAHRLSELGVNLVRMHHHDSEWVQPNIFGDRNTTNSQTLDPTMLERLDWWIKCLRDEGIYIWLDLHVGRVVRRADGIDGFDEISRGNPTAGIEGYGYVNNSIRAAMQRFNEMYLNHENHFTGLRYKDDAAIVSLLITNENDLTNHYGNALLPNKGVPKHTAIYLRQAEEFADRFGLPRDKVWRAWEEGPSKIFLNDLEYRFHLDMISTLHSQGVKSAIVTTSTWGTNPLSSLPALTAGSMIDVHSYGGVGELGKNPINRATFVHWIAAAQVVGKPLTVSEWGVDDHGSLASDRQDIPLYVASSASMQGWSAVMFYAYSQRPLVDDSGTPSIYEAHNDPALISVLPAAALLYRQGHVKEASSRYVFEPSKEMLFERRLSAATSVALRTAFERGKLLIALPRVPELPWLESSVVSPEATIMRDPNQSQIPAGASEAVSDSGELKRNWDQRIFTVNTPRTQAAMGWIGGKTISLAEVDVAVTAKDSVVSVQSMDGRPIGESRKILISFGARSIPRTADSLPFYCEPVGGQILISAPAGLSFQRTEAGDGKRQEADLSYRNGRYVVTLDRSFKNSWLLLQVTPQQRKGGQRTTPLMR
jgi:hypothetical protein